MSDKYCPAGKIECGYYRDNEHGKYCYIDFRNVTQYEVCPWPSRQVGVADNPCAKCTCIDHADSFAKGHTAGRAYQSRKDVDAVEKLVESHPDINVNIENGWIKLLNIIAALREAAKGG